MKQIIAIFFCLGFSQIMFGQLYSKPSGNFSVGMEEDSILVNYVDGNPTTRDTMRLPYLKLESPTPQLIKSDIEFEFYDATYGPPVNFSGSNISFSQGPGKWFGKLAIKVPKNDRTTIRKAWGVPSGSIGNCYVQGETRIGTCTISDSFGTVPGGTYDILYVYDPDGCGANNDSDMVLILDAPYFGKASIMGAYRAVSVTPKYRVSHKITNLDSLSAITTKLKFPVGAREGITYDENDNAYFLGDTDLTSDISFHSKNGMFIDFQSSIEPIDYYYSKFRIDNYDNSIGWTVNSGSKKTRIIQASGVLSLIGGSSTNDYISFVISGGNNASQPNTIVVTDNSNAKRGVQYAADYGATIKNNQRSLPDVGAVRSIIADSLMVLRLKVDNVITTGGVTGDQTIDKYAGSVNFAATDASLEVTNSLVTSNSIIICTIASNDATMTSVTVEASSGAFTIYPNAPPTSETRVNFLVIN